MRRTIAALCCLLLLTACARAETDTETTAAETAASETAVADNAAQLTAAENTEPSQTRTETEPFPTVRTLPGHIASDVYVRLWDGDVAPGLRAGDAESVKTIIAAQTWGDSFDNLSDVWIEAEFVPYAYDTQGGILTSADDRAAKLADAERAALNAILAHYLPGYDEGRGFFTP